nr:MAG TPA: hypothetical protein [Caudoviricetes sp.]
MEKQYSNDRQHLTEYIDYGRIHNVEKARLTAHAAVEEKFNKRLNLITLVTFISAIVFSVLITLGMLLLLAAGVHYIWG